LGGRTLNPRPQAGGWRGYQALGAHCSIRPVSHSTDAMAVRNQETVLLLDHVPIRLPAPLTRLLSEFADQPRPPGWATNYPNR